MARAVEVISPGAGFRDDPAPRAQGDVRVGPLRAALPAVVALAAVLIVISEIAAAPTFASGVESSTWTPLRGVAALVFGTGAYGGDFAPLPILAGAALLGLYGAVFGSLGAVALLVTLGPRTGPAVAIVAGVGYGLLMQAVLINVVVNSVQAQPTVYHSLPSWGWWVAHGAFGAILGLVLAGRDAR